MRQFSAWNNSDKSTRNNYKTFSQKKTWPIVFQQYGQIISIKESGGVVSVTKTRWGKTLSRVASI